MIPRLCTSKLSQYESHRLGLSSPTVRSDATTAIRSCRQADVASSSSSREPTRTHPTDFSLTCKKGRAGVHHHNELHPTSSKKQNRNTIHPALPGTSHFEVQLRTKQILPSSRKGVPLTPTQKQTRLHGACLQCKYDKKLVSLTVSNRPFNE